MKLCKIEECVKKFHCQGYCSMHYMRLKTHGDPHKTLRNRYATPEESFAARTEWQGDCLVWTGAQSVGYGVISVGGGGTQTTSHRYAYSKEYGDIPEGLFVDHRCHNTLCVNHKHLRLATNKQNMENRSGLRADNTSGHTGVYLDKRKGRWYVRVKDADKIYSGGTFPPYELHVASFHARVLRNKYHTFNDLDRK